MGLEYTRNLQCGQWRWSKASLACETACWLCPGQSWKGQLSGEGLARGDGATLPLKYLMWSCSGEAVGLARGAAAGTSEPGSCDGEELDEEKPDEHELDEDEDELDEDALDEKELDEDELDEDELDEKELDEDELDEDELDEQEPDGASAKLKARLQTGALSAFTTTKQQGHTGLSS